LLLFVLKTLGSKKTGRPICEVISTAPVMYECETSSLILMEERRLC